jgi:flagellar hook-associated protein 2
MSTSSTSIVNSVLSATGSSSSGINVTALVASIISTDETGMNQLQTQQATFTSQTSALNTLETQAATLSDDLDTLSNLEGPLNSVAATSSNNGVLTASTSSSATQGTYTVTVDSLAQTASSYSNEVASASATLGTGSFDLTEGGVTQTFTTGSGVDTLNQLVSSINTQNLGVTASIVSDSNGSRLSLVSSSSGAAAAFSITNATGALSFTQATAGADASLKVNGVPITSSSNTVTSGIPGVTLNLTGASTSPVTLSVAPDASSIVSAITSFVNDYNTLIQNVNTQFAYNSTTNTAGTLAGDSTVEGLQSTLLSSTNYSYSGGSYTSLASMGITTNNDGTLSISTSTLNAAITNNPSGVTQFFQGTALNGFADTLTKALNTYIDPSQGAFTVELNSIASEQTDLSTQISADQTYFANLQTTLTAQYNEVDIELQQLPVKLQQTDALLGLNTNNSNNNG